MNPQNPQNRVARNERQKEEASYLPEQWNVYSNQIESHGSVESDTTANFLNSTSFWLNIPTPLASLRNEYKGFIFSLSGSYSNTLKTSVWAGKKVFKFRSRTDVRVNSMDIQKVERELLELDRRLHMVLEVLREYRMSGKDVIDAAVGSWGYDVDSVDFVRDLRKTERI